MVPLRETANILADKDDWPALYDLDQLARNEVPTFAAVYYEDMYVGPGVLPGDRRGGAPRDAVDHQRVRARRPAGGRCARPPLHAGQADALTARRPRGVRARVRPDVDHRCPCGGLSTATGSVTWMSRQVKRNSAAGRPPEGPDNAVRPVVWSCHDGRGRVAGWSPRHGDRAPPSRSRAARRS